MPKDSGSGAVAGERLRAFVERVERLHEERKALSEDIAEVYSEAKGVGFDVKTIKKVVALRRLDEDDRDEQDALLDTYLSALGMKTATRERVPAREHPAPAPDPVEYAKRLLEGAERVEIDLGPNSTFNQRVRDTLLEAGWVQTRPGHFEPRAAAHVAATPVAPEPAVAAVPLTAAESDRVYEEGYRARGAAKRLDENPYRDLGDPVGEFALWTQGWKDRDGEEAPMSAPFDAVAVI